MNQSNNPITKRSDNNLDTMIQEARCCREQAYAPYSNFYVGTCIKTDKGNLYSGCNVENASYGLTMCAEASAIANMVSKGEQTIAEVVLIGDGENLITPCGACRQQLNEFAKPDTLIHICGLEGFRKTMTMAELLPESFGPTNLNDDQ